MPPPAAASLSARLARALPAGPALEPTLIAAVEREAIALERSPGTVLFDVGSPCSGLLVLEAGVVSVSRAADEGRPLQLYRIEPGETCVLSVSCLLGGEEYPARGVVERTVRGILLPPALFERLTAGSERFRRFVFRAFTERLFALVDLAAAVAFEQLDRRLARALLERMRTSERFVLTVTHAELAAELASSRERVSRLLAGFAGAGLVEQGRGTITVRDRDGLARWAGEAEG
jgi:CRP/FNR family transcriptional regulator